MAFVNEQISAMDKQRIDYDSLRDPQGGGPIVVASPKWTADSEREAFLIRLGGGMSREDYQVPFYFLFGWKGWRIRVDAYRRREPSVDPMLGKLTWEVIRFELPESLSAVQGELLCMLTEAFVAYGSTGFPKDSHLNLKSVQVDFSKLNGEV